MKKQIGTKPFEIIWEQPANKPKKFVDFNDLEPATEYKVRSVYYFFR